MFFEIFSDRDEIFKNYVVLDDHTARKVDSDVTFRTRIQHILPSLPFSQQILTSLCSYTFVQRSQNPQDVHLYMMFAPTERFAFGSDVFEHSAEFLSNLVGRKIDPIRQVSKVLLR